MTATGFSDDAFIVKLNSSGNFQWAKRFGGTMNDGATHLAIDSNYVYITGSFKSTVDFDPGPGVKNVTAAGTDPNGDELSSHPDVFVLKLKLQDGNFQWVATASNTSNVTSGNIVVDHAGDLVVTCSSNSAVSFIDSSGATTIAPISQAWGYLWKLNASGITQWSLRTGGMGSEIEGLDVDNNDNIYLGGSFTNYGDFDPGPDTAYFMPVVTSVKDCFWAKFSSSGTFQWAKVIGGQYADFIEDIDIDPYGNIITSAESYSNVLDFDPGPDTFYSSVAGNDCTFIHKMIPGTIPLGIQDIALQAEVSGLKSVKLKWEVNDDQEIKNYIVCRSGDGKSWKQITEVRSSRNESNKTYHYTDMAPEPGDNYFVVRAVTDLNEPFSSNIAFIRMGNINNGSVILSPNPVVDLLRVNIPETYQNTELSIRDITGKIFLQKMIKGHQFVIETSLLPSGVYYLTIVLDNTMVVKPFIKH